MTLLRHQSTGIAQVTPPPSTEVMNPHRLELADIFRTHQQDFLARWNPVLSRQHRKALHDIRDCRTAVLGGHLYECDRCGHRVKVFNSCLPIAARNGELPITCLMGSNSLWRV